MIELCLIPEITSPQFVHEFMPIALCNTIYKVMSKVIVIMLNNRMDKVVSPFQSGFIPGRRIQDNIVVAQEMMHSMHKVRGKTYFSC